MTAFNTEVIDKINEQLEALTNALDGYQEQLQSIVDSGGEQAQELLNAKVKEIGDKISVKLKPIRDKAVKAIKPPIKDALKIVQPIIDLMNFQFSLDTIIQGVMMIVDIIVGPYQPLIQIVTEVVPKLEKLSENIQKVASYQIKVDTSKTDLNVPPLSIDIEPIDVSDLTA